METVLYASSSVNIANEYAPEKGKEEACGQEWREMICSEGQSRRKVERGEQVMHLFSVLARTCDRQCRDMEALLGVARCGPCCEIVRGSLLEALKPGNYYCFEL